MVYLRCPGSYHCSYQLLREILKYKKTHFKRKFSEIWENWVIVFFNWIILESLEWEWSVPVKEIYLRLEFLRYSGDVLQAHKTLNYKLIKQLISGVTQKLELSVSFNPFPPHVLFRRFQGLWKGNIGLKWVKL